VCFEKEGTTPPKLDGVPVAVIFSDLSVGQSDLTVAKQLASNAGVSFQGTIKTGGFDIDGDLV